jgi:periplasmic divalent cation tolerance protein
MLLVLLTFPSLEKAREIASALVESQLAACVNLVPAIESIYRWQGSVHRDAEVLGIVKTTAEALPALEARVRELHPYKVPEFIALKPEHVAAPYAAWVAESVPAPR